MIQIVTADGRREREVLQAMRARAAQAGAEINKAVAAILEDVRENGYTAVAACSRAGAAAWDRGSQGMFRSVSSSRLPAMT